MKTYITKQQKLHVIDTWNGEEHGPIFDWAQDNGYVAVVQVEELDRAQERALTSVQAGASAVEVKQNKHLVILGRKLYDQTTVELGGILVIREDDKGRPCLLDISSEYLAEYYRESAE